MNKVINTVRAIIAVILIGLFLIFCFQNMQSVEIRVFSAQLKDIPLFIALFGTLVFGGFIGYLVGVITGNKKRAANKGVEKETIKQTQSISENTEENL